MEQMLQCEEGHFFDKSKNKFCPFCGFSTSLAHFPRQTKKTKEKVSRLNLRIFISSTFEDLKEYRQATFNAIQSLGAYAEDMIHWSADERSGASLSVDRVKQCDLVILLVAHRYGYTGGGLSTSITELEYEAARIAGIPIFAYFLDENEPWPPRWIEREHLDELQAFKKRVESEVMRKTFRNPDELGRLVTQALALHIERDRESPRSTPRFIGHSAVVDTATTLQSQPDVIVLIGTSEAGLPLLLCIRRSHDLTPHLEALAAEMAGSSSSIQTLLSSFKQSLETHGRQAWARDRLFPVSRADGSINELYVSRKNLAGLFRSTLSLILNEAVAETRQKLVSSNVTNRTGITSHLPRGQRDQDEWTIPQWRNANAGAALQSEGGNNRFLGIDPISGSVIAVGKKDGRWVEWRPFLHESIQASIPEARYSIDGGDALGVEQMDLQRLLLDTTVEQHFEGTKVPIKVSALVSRQQIALLLAAIAHRLAESHSRKVLHGDLKPDNILLGADGIELIDGFNVTEGEIWPGWTPNWAAPEQILGEPANFAADIYPIGRMIARMLGGHLVGEVRKFKARPTGRGVKEFDIFYNPSVFIDGPSQVASRDAINAWRSLACECLRFAPQDRPQSARELGDRILATGKRHPLRGQFRIPIGGDLHMATLPDGSQAIASVLEDVPVSN